MDYKIEKFYYVNFVVKLWKRWMIFIIHSLKLHYQLLKNR